MNDFSKYSDEQLSQALFSDKKNAERAFAEIYSKNSNRVYHYCLRVTGVPEDAKDIFQEVFLKFYKTASEAGSVSNINRLLISIARNLCLNYKRDKKPNIELEDFKLVADNKTYEQKELAEIISRSIELLKEDLKEAFILRVQQGFTYNEIAEITGDPESTIKTRVWRARAKLMEILEPYLEDEA